MHVLVVRAVSNRPTLSANSFITAACSSLNFNAASNDGIARPGATSALPARACSANYNNISELATSMRSHTVATNSSAAGSVSVRTC